MILNDNIYLGSADSQYEMSSPNKQKIIQKKPNGSGGNIAFRQGIQHIFFVGIGGIGMSAIAKILMENGYKISGSDQNPNELTSSLKNNGATIYENHQSQNITNNVDLLIYSSAIPENNPERKKALDKKIPSIRSV